MDFSGLKASLGKFELNKNQAGMIYNIEIDKIRPNPNQPRKDFDDGELLELAEDMKRNGLIQPIVVRPDAENPGMFIIVTGERRYRAAKLNSDARIRAVVNEDWKDDEIGYVQMSENLQRSDLKFWELADFIIAHADAGEKQSEIAKKLGISKSRVSQYMKWKEIPDFIKENRKKLKAIDTALELARMSEDEARKLLDETPEGEFVSRVQAVKAMKPEETPAPAETVSDTAPENSGETAGTEAESFTSEPDSGSTEAPEGAAESFAESSDTGTADSGSSSDDSFFSEGSTESSDSSSGETEFTGDSGSSGSSESFSESSGTEESFTSETDSGSTESAAESSDTGTADSGSSSDDSFFSEGSSDSSESSDAASGETDSGSDSSFMFDLDKPADDEFRKPIIVGSVDGREAELLWKKKPQTDGWVVVKYEDGTTEEVLAERYKLNRIYEIN